MDFSRVPDDVLDRAVAQIAAGRPTEISPEDAAALQAEHTRRKGRAAPAVTAPKPGDFPDPVESAAAPITPDPPVKPKASPRDAYTAAAIEDGWTPEEAEIAANAESGMREGSFNPALWNSPSARAQSRAGARYVRGQRAQEAALDSALADAMGHNYAPPDVTGPDMVMVDGVPVRAHLLSDGRPFGGMYTLGALREAKDAAEEAQWLAGHREMVKRDNEQYGWQLPTAMVSPAQAEARVRLKDAEERQRAQRQASRQYQIDHANDPLTPYEKQQAERRKLRSVMARLAGGSQNLNSDNNAMFQALAMLEGVDPSKMDAQQQAMMQMMPMNPVRGQVEAQNMANAGDVIKRYFTSGALGTPGGQGPERDIAIAQAESQLPPEAQAARHVKDASIHPSEVSAADAYVSTMYSSPMGLLGNSSDFSIQEQQATLDHLINDLGYDPAKAQKIVDEIARRRHASSWAGNSIRTPAAAPNDTAPEVGVPAPVGY